jgi:hypothetical protein
MENKKVIVNFWCNAGQTEEEFTIFIDPDLNQEEQIREHFLKWLDNNEQCGWDVIA